MPKKGQFKPRRGFARVPGESRRYIELRTGKELSRRQYTKRTEEIRSLEEKRDRLREIRKERGEPPPMLRYNALTAQYKLTHPGKHVRGTDSEEFRNAYKTYTKPFRYSHKAKLSHLKSAAILGTITREQWRNIFNSFPELMDDINVDMLFDEGEE